MVKPVLRCLFSALAEQLPEDFTLYGLQDCQLSPLFCFHHLGASEKKENVS